MENYVKKIQCWLQAEKQLIRRIGSTLRRRTLGTFPAVFRLFPLVSSASLPGESWCIILVPLGQHFEIPLGVLWCRKWLAGNGVANPGRFLAFLFPNVAFSQHLDSVKWVRKLSKKRETVAAHFRSKIFHWEFKIDLVMFCCGTEWVQQRRHTLCTTCCDEIMTY